MFRIVPHTVAPSPRLGRGIFAVWLAMAAVGCGASFESYRDDEGSAGQGGVPDGVIDDEMTGGIIGDESTDQDVPPDADGGLNPGDPDPGTEPTPAPTPTPSEEPDEEPTPTPSPEPSPTPTPTPTPPPAPPQPEPEPQPVGEERVLKSATLRGVNGYTGRGLATIVETTSGGYALVFDDDFRFSNVPDPVVVLNSRNRVGIGLQAGDYRIASLPTNRRSGAQRFAITEDAARATWVWIWCEAFGVDIAGVQFTDE